ncbi:MAG: putative secreted Zn-dependent protease, partial [Saprospiraceae bacterium]
LTLLSSHDRQKGIRHDLNKALTWDDFKGRVERGSKYAANTSSGFNYNASMVGDSMRIILPTIFHPRQSWVKKKQKSAYLLKHEQVHFDITELFVRKMRKEILYRAYNLKKFNKNVSKILKKYSRESSSFQNQYDKETKHSLNKEAQEKWNQIVAKSLSELEAYKNPILMVGVQI